MVFKELQKGYTLYIFNLNNAELTKAVVSDVSKPHITGDKTKIATNNLMTVVDVSVVLGDKTQTIELPETMTSTVSNDNSLLITANKDDAINGIRMLKTRSEEAIKMKPKHEEIIAKCNSILKEEDPMCKAAFETEERLKSMQNYIEEQKKTNEQLLQIIQQQQEDIKILKNSLTPKK